MKKLVSLAISAAVAIAAACAVSGGGMDSAAASSSIYAAADKSVSGASANTNAAFKIIGLSSAGIGSAAAHGKDIAGVSVSHGGIASIAASGAGIAGAADAAPSGADIAAAGKTNPQPPQIDAGAYILIDSETGDVLCEKNSRTKTIYPASTTKIMTAILALELDDLNQEMTASQSAIDDIGPDGSNIGIIAGEKIKLANLLEAMLISSANEAANIIAENLCPTRQNFVDLMNKKAKELGATGTHFANPCGAHDPQHYTTAADMAIFARYAMSFPEFRRIVSTRIYKMPPTNKHPDWPVLSNTNKLMITGKSDLYQINGIKTGYTGPAGYNLVSSAMDSSGMELISVVMDVTGDGAQENVRKFSKELLDYGFTNFKRVSLLAKGSVYRNIRVESAADVYGLDLIASDGLICTLPKGASLQSIKEIPHIRDVSAPVNKGDIEGYVEYFRDGISIGKVDLIAARSVEHKPEPVTLRTRLKEAVKSPYFKIPLYIAGFLIFFLMLRTVLKHISRRVKTGKTRKY